MAKLFRSQKYLNPKIVLIVALGIGIGFFFLNCGGGFTPIDSISYSSVSDQNQILRSTFDCSSPELKSTPVKSISRLKKIHYINSIREFLSPLGNVEVDKLMRDLQNQFNAFPNDDQSMFSSFDQSVTIEHSNSLFEIAYQVAMLIAGNTSLGEKFVSLCGANATVDSINTNTCQDKLIKYYGMKAFRRPLSTTEVSDMSTFLSSLSSTDRLAGLIARYLAHPNFYYNFETEGEIVDGQEGIDATYKLNRWELLSRLSFLFWLSPPNDALYTLVQNQDIANSPDLTSVLEIIFADSRIEKGLGDFYREWLKLDFIPNFDTKIPAFQTLAAGENIGQPGHNHREAMINEILEMAKYYTLTKPGRYEDLLNSTYSFTTSEDLAKIYSVPVWSGDLDQMVSFTDGKRTGLLTRAAFLISNHEYTRPIIKGKKILNQILCAEVPPPPPSLKVEPLVHDLLTSTRDLVTNRTNSTMTCNACHSTLNPYGFATENFDALGRLRTTETKFDSSGNVGGQVPIKTQVVASLTVNDSTPVKDGAELSQHIADSGLGQACMVRQLYRYSVGRMENLSQDGCSLEKLRASLTQPGSGGLKGLFEQIAQIREIRYRKQN